jgi:hypothetical protein
MIALLATSYRFSTRLVSQNGLHYLLTMKWNNASDKNKPNAMRKFKNSVNLANKPHARWVR